MSAGAFTAVGTSHAQEQENVFQLGRITVIATPDAPTSSSGTVTEEDIWTFNRNTLDQAVTLVPGVMSTFIGGGAGRRNERNIFVRGFDRWHVPLTIDGIRIYLPADNRLDFARFLTQDLAEIQVQKGYVSVLDGPGGMGGSINLVTRKPTEPLETEFRAGTSDGAWDAFALIGSRQENYYVQASVSHLDRDYWPMSDDFTPTSREDGGERNRSYSTDTRYNLKFGYTPNDTDEYTLSYTSQNGNKSAPVYVFNDPVPRGFWEWPWWDIDNLYWLSHTQLGDDSAYLKTRLFYNRFKNGLSTYDDATYTTQQAMMGSFNSPYDDTGLGGSIEFGTALTERNTLAAALHFRRDEHTQGNHNRPTLPPDPPTCSPVYSCIEPRQTMIENTWSLALENMFAATNDLDLIVGLSYDKNDVLKAESFNNDDGLFEYPTGGSDAVNAQTALHWRYADARQLHASVSSRTRFPTRFERFSGRMGSGVANPDLEPERATNFELGWTGLLSDRFELTTALFYSDLKDMIQSVVVGQDPVFGTISQSQNVGNGEYYGVEFGLKAQLSAQWHLTANYTHLDREITDESIPGLELTGTPDYQAFIAVTYQPTSRWSITPNVELASDRWSDYPPVAGSFTRVGDYTLLNLQVQYRGSETWDVAFGGSNLLDENIELAYGFPEPGQNYYARLRLNF